MDEEAIGNVNVAEISGNLGGIRHRAAHEGHFAAVIIGEFNCELNAVNRGRKAGDEEALRDAGKNFVELAAYGALAGRVPGALDVGGILKEREDTFFAVFSETMQVKEAIVSGSGINFEIAGMNDDPERSVNGQRDAIYQAVGFRNGMNGEGAKAEALTSPNFVQVGIVEEFVFFEL